ncbi:hypothetical protein HAX54_037600 [Datura stramonium]|uniref:Myb-like domain-containing protein n=1 Tax=Datura stramonium TaxID=4076 RepID=A0ABS8SHK2_DATST|nr:hypothetical protein [Datura stramonium]
MGCQSSKAVDAATISRWRSTGIVSLRDSKLKTFPDEVFDLERSVRTLDLTHNKMVEIPMEINKLTNLQRLILADNIIERLPINLGLLESLKVATLDGNRITNLPEELGQLVKLERLSVSANLLTSLPDTIGSLRSLVLLNISNNKLKFLPDSIGSCFSLEELQANDNSIEELPGSICNLVQLKSLCLNNNNLNRMPPNLLRECKSLQNIALHGNPITMDQFQQMEGFQEFEIRRKMKFDKQIDSNVIISSKGLDEGVDLSATPILTKTSVPFKLIMGTKRPFGKEDLCEVSSKQPRHELSCKLISVLELSPESVAVEAYASGGDEDNSSRIIPDANKKPYSHNVAEVLFSSEKETEMGIHGSTSNSSWPTSSTSEEDIRPEAPFHILTSPEYFYFDHPFRAAAHHREIYSSLSSNPHKMVPIGPDCQAELPEWGAYSNKDKPFIDGIHETLNPSSQAGKNKFAGRTISPMPKMELLADHGKNIGERRVECSCEDIGSIRCVRLHIIEAREILKLALGEETFVNLGFCDMGEVVAEKWSEEEEELFHEVVLSNPVSLGKNFWNHLVIEFPSRSMKELVSYYFNVFILRKRAEQNRFDPLNIDSDNDEWHEIVDDADEGAKMTDEDEDSVIESPAYHNDLSYNMIHEEHDRRIYDEDVRETWEDYKPVSFGSRKVFTDVQESCPGKLFDSNSSYKLSMQPQDQVLSNKVIEQEVQGGSCTTDAAVVPSESSLGKTNNDKHWASEIAGMGSGAKHDSLLEPCSSKEWDIGYLSCARNEVDLLPTHTMIEEVFGDGAWIYKSRDG